MSKFLTVKDAMKLVGKSESTIKRLLREITTDADHADREFIQPSHDEVEERREAGEPYIWKISSELLEKRYPKTKVDQQGSDDTKKASSSRSADDEIISVLREQMVSKDRQLQTLENQLNKKDEQISNQNERMRETNILMKDLQQRLVIAAPAKPADIVVENSSEQGNVASSKPTEVKEKRSIWKRSFSLFGNQS